MLISLSLHLILLMFELLACDKLTSDRHLWVLVFIPLIFGSVVSVGACVWAVKHDRSFELELFLAVNALQFVSLPLKLDKFVNWNWDVVFVPMWIVICLSLVSVLYNIIFCGIMMRTPEVSLQQKKAALNAAVGNICTVLPLLCFQVNSLLHVELLQSMHKLNCIYFRCLSAINWTARLSSHTLGCSPRCWSPYWRSSFLALPPRAVTCGGLVYANPSASSCCRRCRSCRSTAT